MGYHREDLRAELVRAATELLGRVNPGELSLREVARQAGVSHAAPAHHFGDKRGLLTTIAAEGFELLARALQDARRQHPDDPYEAFLAGGHAYVSFAQDHPSHFAVMFRAELHRAEDASLATAAGNAYEELMSMARLVSAARALPEAAWLAWAFVHGVASLGTEGQWRLVASSDDSTEIYARLAPAVLNALRSKI